jgi:hypothetical protein
MPAQTRWIDIVFALYLGLVCAIALSIGTVMAGSALTTLVDMAFPYEYAPPAPIASTPQNPQPTAEDLKQQQVRDRAIQRHNNLRELLHNAIYFTLVSGVFAYHWRLFRLRLKAA